ncbi:MAG: TonB-dependent receptor [Tannerella sp.]|jgi:hypothetical protein|nr:TonB-dependent receptor [Tannerella sp.]
MKKIFMILACATVMHPVSLLKAQPSGNIRGTVFDVASGQTLPAVTITVLQSNPMIGTISDANGQFDLKNLPVGRYDIQCSYIGYEPAVFREIRVTSGKEVFIEITMRENVHVLGEVTVRPTVNKEAPLNPMVLASARMLSVEEASRYAGALDDPARLVTAFAGVSGGLSNNGISIRGNSPMYLQWRLEGMEAVNPTHFSDITGVGGGIISALSSHVLGNSDFFTGAFPAEYGNALSGVFDMQLRNGNNQQYEHAVQTGALGLEFTSEGPLKKGKPASYLINYRYSTLALMSDLFPGLVGDAAGMRYQDLTFKFNFPTKKAGTFSLWGIWIKDHYIAHISKDTTTWDGYDQHDGFGDLKVELVGTNADFWQTKAVGGIGHRVFLNEKTYLKSAIVANYTQNKTTGEFVFPRHEWDKVSAIDMKNTNWNVAFNTYLNTKFSASHTNRTGINVTGLFFKMDYWLYPDLYDNPDYPPQGQMVNFTNDKGNSMAFSAYSQSTIRLNNNLTANMGLHATYFHLNEKTSIDPRAGIRWQALPKHAFSLSYGKHSRRENTDYYFIKTPGTGDELVNRNLDFAKAHHYVLSYDWSISEYIRVKVEPYFQSLYDIPVEKDSHLSLINYFDFLQMLPKLVNDGKGENYGIDVTLERYLHRGYYYLLTGTLFESRYKDGNGDWRNTRLNRNYIVNALGGKEWKMGKQKQNILNASVRMTLQGGERYIPVDETASKAVRNLVYDNMRAYELQRPPEFLCHFNLGYKINRNKLSHEFALQIMNLFGSKEYYDTYNYVEDRPELVSGTVLLPNIYYKIEF